MTTRASRGCSQCRTRKVKCDEGRPACQRCVQRGDSCTGYRDEASLFFRDENQKTARKVLRRAKTIDTPPSSISSPGVDDARLSRRGREGDTSRPETSLSISQQYRCDQDDHQEVLTSEEDRDINNLFDRLVLYPCNHGSSPGFLEHLPSLFQDVMPDGRMALRWAVQAAACAGISAEQTEATQSARVQALGFYSRALSCLSEALADSHREPDDYTLMTVVILDIFETLYLGDEANRGSHAEGMSHILRLRGPNQICSPRGWSLFRLAHHRIQKEQLAYKQAPLKESQLWMESLDKEIPCIHTEKDNHDITKICQRARTLLSEIDRTDLSISEILAFVEEMRGLDAASVRWRDTPDWSYKVIPASDYSQYNEQVQSIFLTDSIELHPDVWIAYEWNYHRTARIILHEHLLACLNPYISDLPSSSREEQRKSIPSNDQYTLLQSYCQQSTSTIHILINQILSTVPQSLGDITHEGKIPSPPNSSNPSTATTEQITKCRGIGAYFLLWPIKIIKQHKDATEEQRKKAKGVFERIRMYTGMKRVLGGASCI